MQNNGAPLHVEPIFSLDENIHSLSSIDASIRCTRLSRWIINLQSRPIYCGIFPAFLLDLIIISIIILFPLSKVYALSQVYKFTHFTCIEFSEQLLINFYQFSCWIELLWGNNSSDHLFIGLFAVFRSYVEFTGSNWLV